jgi:hypothetical protein
MIDILGASRWFFACPASLLLVSSVRLASRIIYDIRYTVYYTVYTYYNASEVPYSPYKRVIIRTVLTR